jgi:hypothetical protein
MFSLWRVMAVNLIGSLRSCWVAKPKLDLAKSQLLVMGMVGVHTTLRLSQLLSFFSCLVRVGRKSESMRSCAGSTPLWLGVAVLSLLQCLHSSHGWDVDTRSVRLCVLQCGNSITQVR